MRDLYKRVARRRRKGEGGFTLIELLVVIAILSVLAAIVVFNVTGVKQSGDAAACQTDVQSVQSAVDAYINDQLPSANLGDFTGEPTTATALSTAQQSDLVPKYIQTNPTACGDHTAWDGIFAQLDSSGSILITGK